MWFKSFLRKTGRGPARARRSFAPGLESLEERTVPSTLTVLNNLDKGPGSLRDTITNAKSGDTIVFAPSLNGQTITLTSDQLTLNKSLDIEGPGPSLLAISGNDANRIFSINEGFPVTIDGLTITHGLAVGGEGGAILNLSTSLSLANDVFSANVALGFTAGTRGGAIANLASSSGSLTVTDSTFIANRADGRVKKANFAEGGAIFGANNGQSMTILRCTFRNNQAIGGDGGDLAPSGCSGFALGAASGGALHSEGASKLTVIDSTFVGNQAIGGSGASALDGNKIGMYYVDGGEGGAIVMHDGATLILSGSTFAYNQAIGGSNAAGATVGLGWLGVGIGGGVDNEGPATITNCTFLGNQALGGSGNTGGSGGGLLVGVGYGGALDNELAAASLSVSNCTFTNNQAVGGAGNTGGLFAGDGVGGGLSAFFGVRSTVTDSTFSGNQAVGGAGSTSVNGADGLGGALANVLGSTLAVSGCTLSGNQVVGGAGGTGTNGGNGFGGGVYNDGLSLFPGNLGTPTTLTVLGSTITDNAAVAGAAGVGGSDSQGIGGGAYFAFGGSVCLDALTSILGNTASTSDNDVFGAFTLC
jgi:hypothetical protein